MATAPTEPTEQKLTAEQKAAIAAAATYAAAQTPQMAAGLDDTGGSVGRVGVAVKTMKKFVSAMIAIRAAHQRWLERELLARARARGEALDRSFKREVSDIVKLEQARGREFDRRALKRLARDVPKAVALPVAARDEAFAKIMERERRYIRMRSEAMGARAVAALDRAVLRVESPDGAFWKLDPNVKEHTKGCLRMAAIGFLPWRVLDRVHPPRHGGCPCRLIGKGEALSLGLMTADDILPTKEAVKRAATVVMESVEGWASDPDLFELVEMAAEEAS